MHERFSQEKMFLSNFHVDCYRGNALFDDNSDIQDALQLIRQGIWELRGMNGLEGTKDHQADYLLVQDTSGLNIIEWMNQRKMQEARLQKATSPEEVAQSMREPFLMVCRNITDGIVGVLDGRMYTYQPTGDKTLMINWVVTRNSGTNDNHTHTYRRAKVASLLYDNVEKLARANNVELLLAAINRENIASQKFHKNKGFILEPFVEGNAGYDNDGDPLPYKTDRGAFIPPYVFEFDNNNNPAKLAEFYTKRLSIDNASK